MNHIALLFGASEFQGQGIEKKACTKKYPDQHVRFKIIEEEKSENGMRFISLRRIINE